MTSRRHFIALLPLAGGAALVRAQAPGPVLDPKDPQAAALGYVVDATKVDKAKYPKYAAGQACSNCQLYQGAANSAMGPCPIYQNKQVAAKGWCSAWAKKA
ncbi:MAG: high-potential iron-sulfur protein [Burkholderiaceae bacterium]